MYIFLPKRNYLLVIILILFCFSINADDGTLEVNLSIKDHRFFPEVLELPKGRKIRLIVHNQDSTAEEFESIDLKREKLVAGNSFIHVILAPLKPGRYEFFGDFHQETAKGVIIVNHE
jgi:hypothetical protein